MKARDVFLPGCAALAIACGGKAVGPLSSQPELPDCSGFPVVAACNGQTASYAPERGVCVAHLPACRATAAAWDAGAQCRPGASMSYVAADAGACLTTCSCQESGFIACSTDCAEAAPVVPHEDCAQGAACHAGDACSGPPASAEGCARGCACDRGGHYACVTTCPNDCGLPAGSCALCTGGAVACTHFVLAEGVCLLEQCPEDGVVMPTR